MAPQRVRNAPDDARSEASSGTKEKHPQLHHSPHASVVSKGKRPASNHAGGGGSNLRDVTSAPANTGKDAGGESAGGLGSGAEGGIGGVRTINWSTVPTSSLRAYRHAHRLNIPSSFSSLQNQLTLTNPQGLGRYSPSMIGARRLAPGREGNNIAGESSGDSARHVSKERRSRVSNESLALAVRKDFNAQGVSEMEVVTEFLYVVRNQSMYFVLSAPHLFEKLRESGEFR